MIDHMTWIGCVQSLCKLVSQLMTKRQFTSETPCNNIDSSQHQFRLFFILQCYSE